MPVEEEIPFSEGVFFITFTCYDWIALFEITNGYDLVYKWFDHLKSNGHYIIGYQTMPNHLHAVIAFCNSGKSINRIIDNGKRFLAYEIVQRLEQQQEHEILERLREGVNISDKKRGKRHEIWERSFDWKECYSNEIIEQKLEYMHDNPCSGKWNLVDDPADYVHSSAKYYLRDEQGIYPVTNYMELEDIDLTKPASPARDPLLDKSGDSPGN